VQKTAPSAESAGVPEGWRSSEILLLPGLRAAPLPYAPCRPNAECPAMKLPPPQATLRERAEGVLSCSAPCKCRDAWLHADDNVGFGYQPKGCSGLHRVSGMALC
jgi:hypothetical protein